MKIPKQICGCLIAGFACMAAAWKILYRLGRRSNSIRTGPGATYRRNAGFGSSTIASFVIRKSLAVARLSPTTAALVHGISLWASIIIADLS